MAERFCLIAAEVAEGFLKKFGREWLNKFSNKKPKIDSKEFLKNFPKSLSQTQTKKFQRIFRKNIPKVMRKKFL